MKKNKAYLLIDALMAFLIFSTVVCLIYGGYISLLNGYQKSQNNTLERFALWEKEMEIP